MMSITCIVFILISNHIIHCNSLEISKDKNNFGPYDVNWSGYRLCRGPKSRNATNVTFNLIKRNDEYFCIVNIEVLFQTSLDEIKVWVYKMKDESRSLLWVYKTEACKHFAFAEIIKREMHSKNCAIEKGLYKINLNITELTKKLLGPSFFYGNYSMKSTTKSKKANFMCISLDLELSKRRV